MDFGLPQKRDSLCHMSCLQAKNMQDLTRRKEIHTFRIMLVKAAFLATSSQFTQKFNKGDQEYTSSSENGMGANPRPIQVNQTIKNPQTCNTKPNTKKTPASKKTDPPFVWQREWEEGTCILASIGAGEQQGQVTRADLLRCNGLKVKAQVTLRQETPAASWPLGAQPGSRSFPTHLKALTHFAILYEKHVERD